MRLRTEVEHIHLSRKEDPELLAKLNAVAPYEHRSVHGLVKYLLDITLDKKIQELGIGVPTQPTVG